MLNLKSIISCNINGTPLTSCNLSKRIYEYKKFIDENVKEKFLDDELFIISIQGLYGYRSGILGYLFNRLSFELSQNNNPTLLKSFLNLFVSNDIEANDFEIFSTSLSMISRKIPILNIGNWDLKNYISNEYINSFIPNKSLPSIFDLKSLYLLNPLFDSGCTIISNKEHLESGFERWNIIDSCNFSNKLFNQGINWAYFESNDKKNGISIINFDLVKKESLYNSQFIQLLDVKKKLEKKFAYDSILVKYETFIVGDFNFEFNLKNIIEEVDKKWEIFEKNQLQILNDKDISSTKFILYNKYYETTSKNINLNILNNTNFLVEDDKIVCIDFTYDEINNEEVKENEVIENEVIEINDEIYIESSSNENIEENIKNEIEKVKSIEKIEYNISDDIINNDIIITINDDYFYKNPLNKNSDDEWEAI